MEEERRSRQLPIVFGALALLALATTAGTAFSPALLVHAPLSLIALSPEGRHLILVAPLVPFVAFVAVAAARRAFSAFLGFKVGQLYGDQALEWVERKSPRAGRWLRVFEKWFEHAGIPLLILLPGLTTAGLAGASGMSVWLVVPLLLTGQLLWMSVTFYVGEALRDWIMPIVAAVQEHVIEATLVCVTLAVGYQLYRRSRSGESFQELAELEEAPEAQHD